VYGLPGSGRPFWNKIKRLKEGKVNFIEPVSLYLSLSLSLSLFFFLSLAKNRASTAIGPFAARSFSPPRVNITIPLRFSIKGDSRFHPRVLREGLARVGIVLIKERVRCELVALVCACVHVFLGAHRRLIV